MKKLKCRDYLNHANTREQLYVYVEYLSRAHRHNLPHTIKLVRLATSSAFDKRAYAEVDFLAGHVEENYNR